MMTFEAKCVLWKRLGAEQVQAHIENLTLEEELVFWQKQTEALKASQRAAQEKTSNHENSQPVFPHI